jgi:hypothetical protein
VGAVLGVAIQHVCSIREALLVCLPSAVANSTALDVYALLEDFKIRNKLYSKALLKWLETENLPICQPEFFIERGLAGMFLNESIESIFGSLAGASLQEYENAFQVSREAQDHGTKRSGTGCQNPVNFILTSAFLRLAGAFEEFQKDALKALFYYRPTGLLGQPADQMEQVVQFDDVFEPDSPENNGAKQYRKPVVWNWLRKQVQSKPNREGLFSDVFRIKLRPEGLDEKREWTTIRNAIAHGYEGANLTLRQYVEFEAFVVLSMKHLADQCKAKLKLEL